MRFDPRERITIRVNDHKAPKGSMDDVEEAIRILRAATGLDLRMGRRTRDVPDLGSIKKLEDQRPEILIGWAPRRGWGSSPMLSDRSLLSGDDLLPGVGGWVSLTRIEGRKQTTRIVVGHVALDSDLAVDQLPGFGMGNRRGTILLHELGHAVGLKHVEDPNQIMYPRVTGQVPTYGVGDLNGLAKLGSGAGPIR